MSSLPPLYTHRRPGAPVLPAPVAKEPGAGSKKAATPRMLEGPQRYSFDAMLALQKLHTQPLPEFEQHPIYEELR